MAFSLPNALNAAVLFVYVTKRFRMYNIFVIMKLIHVFVQFVEFSCVNMYRSKNFSTFKTLKFLFHSSGFKLRL